MLKSRLESLNFDAPSSGKNEKTRYGVVFQGFMGSAAFRQFFGVRDYETAQLVSSMLGQQTLEYDDKLRQAHAGQAKRQAAMSILTGGDPFSAAQNVKHNAFLETLRTKQARDLMTPDEILALPEDQQICFISKPKKCSHGMPHNIAFSW